MDPTADPHLRRRGTAALVGIVALTLPCSVRAQAATVVGVVSEEVTGAPLPGVFVSLIEEASGETTSEALTDENGRFAVRGEFGSTYRVRAERVGLAPSTTEPFRLTSETGIRRLAMAEQAVELEGLTVRSPVALCEIEPQEGLSLQRWWEEIRKALRSAAFVHANELDGFRFERFQREWTRDLRNLRGERYFAASGQSARPFLSADAETLSEAGFVQGERGDRRFFAPDAAVLLSDSFLGDHCFDLLADGSDSTSLRIAVEPTRSRDVTDIKGSLLVDTLSMELRSFDFEYINLPDDIPSSAAAGGHLSFEYLPSGAWIVSEWWVRMPWVDPRVWPPTVLAYVDEGGHVTGSTDPADAIGYGGPGAAVRGLVYDSLFGRPLADARVSVLGSRISARTDEDGRFSLAGIPPGRRGITVHHADLARLGIPSPVVSLELQEGTLDSLTLVLPGFEQVASMLCGRNIGPTTSILTGMIEGGEAGIPIASADVRARWLRPRPDGGLTTSVHMEGRAGSDGRYILCGLPSGTELVLSVGIESSWYSAGVVTLADERIAARNLRPSARAMTPVVRGYVSDATSGSALSAAQISLKDLNGRVLARVPADITGQFRLPTPGPGGFLIAASSDGYAPVSSDTLTVAAGDVLDVGFEMNPSVPTRGLGGRVLDSSTGAPIPFASVSLLDRDRNPVALAFADSTGRYSLTAPDSELEEYALLGQALGYHESESPVPTPTESRGRPLDLVLHPEAIELDPLMVKVQNARVLDWLRSSLGANPAQYFGFRILQGARLEEAKRRAQDDPVETLRWLYVPVWHGGPCVSINVTPGAASQGYRWSRQSAFVPGAAPAGTRSAEDAEQAPEPDACGKLYLDGRPIPNEEIDQLDMTTISVITTLPGEVRMFTRDFEWAFRAR